MKAVQTEVFVPRRLLVLALLLGATLPASGQTITLYFSTDGTESALSGIGGTSLLPGNQAAVFRDEEIQGVTPSTLGPDAAPIATSAAWAAWFGDEDGDGNYTERVAGNLDSLTLVTGAPNPPTIFDFWLSFSDDVGPFGFLPGQILRDGDIFRIRPGGGAVTFITETQLGIAMGNTADFDVNGFLVNPQNGDLYWTMSTTQTVGGIALEDGGIARLPASGYVLSPSGTVQSVTPGAAQVALHEVHVDVFYFGAGQGTVGDLDGIALAPSGGTFQGPNGQVPNLWFVGDSPTSGPTIVSTVGGGTVPVVNGVAMTGGAAWGMQPFDYAGGATSTITALAWAPAAMAARPRVLDVADAALLTPGSLRLDAAGFAPGPNFHLFANLGVASPTGSFTPRTELLAGGPLSVAGGFPALFVDDLFDPLFLFMAMLPPTQVDALGYASVTYLLPALPAGVAISVQGIDATNLAPTTPVVLVTP